MCSATTGKPLPLPLLVGQPLQLLLQGRLFRPLDRWLMLQALQAHSLLSALLAVAAVATSLQMHHRRCLRVATAMAAQAKGWLCARASLVFAFQSCLQQAEATAAAVALQVQGSSRAAVLVLAQALRLSLVFQLG